MPFMWEIVKIMVELRVIGSLCYTKLLNHRGVALMYVSIINSEIMSWTQRALPYDPK